MILNRPDGGQRLDPRFGIVQPWYTHGALDDLQARDWSRASVLEWGGGCSTIWWSTVAARVHVIEASPQWAADILATAQARNISNITVEQSDALERHLALPPDLHPRVVCVDGSFRTECLERALKLPRPLTVVFDNWQQDFVYLDAGAEQMMAPYRECGRFYIQADHTNHQGRPWQTAIWDLP